jgi:hypothetical protein
MNSTTRLRDGFEAGDTDLRDVGTVAKAMGDAGAGRSKLGFVMVWQLADTVAEEPLAAEAGARSEAL